MEKQQIGKITHYFPKAKAAVIKLNADLKVGDRVFIEGGDVSFEQEVNSMQIDRKPIDSAKAGDEIGVGVAQDVRPGFLVFKI